MNQRVQRTDPTAATRARTAALARQQVRLQHRRQDQQIGPLAWFAIQGEIDQQVVRAV
jgi:hypothetical protein